VNAIRVFENAKSVRKCVRFGLACVRLHGSILVRVRFGVRDHDRAYDCDRCLCLCSWSHFMNNLQILPIGNVRHFSRVRKNDILF